MATLTIRIPDDQHERLKALAKSRSISVNKLMEELSSVVLAEFDAYSSDFMDKYPTSFFRRNKESL